MMVGLGLPDRDDATMRHFALDVLELDGGCDRCGSPGAELLSRRAGCAPLTEGGISAMAMWQESAWLSEPMLQTCRSWHVVDAFDLSHGSFEPVELHPRAACLRAGYSWSHAGCRTRTTGSGAPMPNERAESIQYCRVSRMAQPPAMTAAVEKGVADFVEQGACGC